MRSGAFTESVVEQAAFPWLESIGWVVRNGADISPAGDTLTLTFSQRERESYGEIVLEQRLRDALARSDVVRPEIRERRGLRRGLVRS